MDCSLPDSSVMEFSRQKYWNGLLHFFLQGIFLTQGLEPRSPALQADSLPTELQGKPIYMYICVCVYVCNGILLKHKIEWNNAICNNLEIIILSEVSQKEKDKYHMIPLIWHNPKYDTKEITYKTGTDSDMDYRLVATKVKGGWGRGGLDIWD